MSRPKRFGRDRNLVSDGTINDVYIYQYFMHVYHTCPCYRPGLLSMYIKGSPMKKHIQPVHVQFLFVNICFLTFFLLYFHGIDKF